MSEGTRDAASAQHRRLLDTIGMRIVEGELAPGARLLTADVAAELGASRSAMREVVRVLETMGMVEVRRRAGVEVLPADRWSAYAPEVLRWRLDGSGRLHALHELSQLRSAIEPLAARLAAAHATPQQRAALVKAVLGMVEHGDRADEPEYLQHDVDFHAAVLRGSGNPYLAGLADAVAALLHGRTAHALMPKRADETALRLHQEVASAITARDPEAAAAAMAAIVAEADDAVEAMASSASSDR
ncbi:FadR/GntR family transcriptional regulator [Microbacterium azadirachtae]|uniref:FadR/GntR family transcriptional regulator n=1 Tax=Microbacterium azadirachtae TaxID=582680 RepID=UPI000887C88C|nr:FCD domain-containing protein [Microbacterium azadirachtae]SDL92429.1 DNA-binding transcriptional regulator, FadR family [Microbacterium azadirachtae]SEG15431.1 DNA-binding transcriptional regulator, FadR family [Microbacterium azadirachtae]SEG18019.1 DNA-binding transcriptional regulator, FadR family [Microbacterium azadirachtae]